MTTKTIRQSPQVIRVLLVGPVLMLAFVGFICGLIAAPLISGFKLGRELSHQFLVLDDLEN